MKIVDNKLNIFKSDYDNWFLFLLPFFNICGYNKYLTINIGWLFISYSCYIDFKKELTE